MEVLKRRSFHKHSKRPNKKLIFFGFAKQAEITYPYLKSVFFLQF